MKTTPIKKSIIYFIAVLALSSCQEYLEDELLSDVSADFLYNTPEGLEDAVVGLYNLNRALYTDSEWNYAIPLIPIAKSDLVVGRAGEISLYARLGWGADLTSFGTRRLSNHWRHSYRIVDRANQIIASVDNVILEDAQRAQILAEARLFRAHAYFTLYRQFNNISITTEPTNPDNAFDRPTQPNTEEEIFALINEDLDFAIENLAWTTEEFGRWTQAGARHIRSKTAMWQGDWTEAAAQADAVINDPSYELVSTTAEVFDGTMNHSETIFAMQFEEAITGGATTNRIHFNFIPQYNIISGATWSIENGSRGTGNLLMNDYLRNLLAEDENDDRAKGNYYISEFTYNDESELPDFAEIGDVIDIYDQYSDSSSERAQYYTSLNPGTIKYLQEDAVVTEANSISNIMVYRLAETYLIGAEAHLMLGNTTTALGYINTVRNRASAASIETIDLQAILDERARELAFEGQRFYTLKRTGVYADFIRDHAGNLDFQDLARSRVMEYMVNWPIPTEELDLLDPTYPQNEGY